MGPPGCSSTRPEAAEFGRTLPVHAKGLAKIGEVGEALDCHAEKFPGPGRICRPAFPRRVFALSVLGCWPREIESTRAGLRAHSEPARLSSAHQPGKP